MQPFDSKEVACQAKAIQLHMGQLFFQRKKLLLVRFEPMTLCDLGRALNPLNYQGSLGGMGYNTIKHKAKVQQLWSTANSHPNYEMADLLGCGLPETDCKHKEMWI